LANGVRLLVADADIATREIVRLAAANENWQSDGAADGISALKLMRRNRYRLVVLDTALPDVDGFLVCRQFRKSEASPVIFISASAAEADKLEGFDAGGNDYVVKPFSTRELVARMKNLLALTGYDASAPHVLTAGKLSADLDSRTVTLNGGPLALTPKEYELLLFFCQHPLQAFSRDMLLDEVWGRSFYGSDRTVDTHVKSLRNKLQPYDYIETVWGYGYKFTQRQV